MPIFDYRCNDCCAIYDVLHKGKELQEDIICPKCGSRRYSKLISLPGLISTGESPVKCDRSTCGMESSCCGDGCMLN